MRALPQTTKRRVSNQVSIPAPTAGLNARDPLAKMAENEAPVMNNYFPTPSSVDSRGGSISHATGMTGTIESLLTYSNGIDRNLFAAVNGDIFDVTSSGVVGAADVTGLLNSRIQSINFGTAGGFFLMCVNGEDKMQIYTGSTWYEDGTTTTVTGFDTADAIHINNFKNRVWFVEKESMKAWYLPVSSIGGAAVAIDFSGIFKLGGYLMAMANWTIDNAAGIDDYAVFVTSEGEVALYKGTDPSSADTWALVGTFRMGRPLGRRCFCKAGADVLLITTDGAFPLSKALLTDRSQMNLAATDKISSLINAATKAYFNNFGWEPIIFPTGTKLIINVPKIENVESIQYVMNTQHGAWCSFSEWNAACFAVLDDKLYYGTADAVIQADTGQSDLGEAIVGNVQQAYSYFQSGGIQKIFKMARPIMISEGTVVPSIRMSVDYKENTQQPSTENLSSGGATWDLATWDLASWTSGVNISSSWQSISGVGIAGGLKLSSSLTDIDCKWVSTDVIYEKGGSL
jgi:hypothetical protein